MSGAGVLEGLAGADLGAASLGEALAGPVGWVLLGATILVVAAVAISAASKSADEELSESAPDEGGKCPVQTEEATPEQIASEGKPDPDRPTLKDGGRQIIKDGGMDGANKDFDRLNPQNVQDKGEGVRVGDLPDGRKAIVRPNSEPTLEIQSDGVPDYKIRYR